MTKPITIKDLEDKVQLISALTGIQFVFERRLINPYRGYIMKTLDPEKQSPYMREVIGRSRVETNHVLNAILAGIGYVLDHEPTN